MSRPREHIYRQIRGVHETSGFQNGESQPDREGTGLPSVRLPFTMFVASEIIIILTAILEVVPIYDFCIFLEPYQRHFLGSQSE